jgi:SAM-dependent methyltransferase
MTSPEYVLGRTEGEYERLREQARMWEPETARLLAAGGIGPGLRCLDVGCGPGEVMRLMAERVGPRGEVTGVDVDGALGAHALETLRATGHPQCSFQQLDVIGEDEVDGAPYDLVFARLLLIHVDDPAALLEKLWRWVAPGGCMVIADYDILAAAVVPEPPVIADFVRIAQGTFSAAGRDLRTGMRLPELHVRAGIGAPDGIDAGLRIGLLPELAPLYEGVMRSVTPTAVDLGLASESECVQWFERFGEYVADPAAAQHAAMWSPLVGTWKRRTGADAAA